MDTTAIVEAIDAEIRRLEQARELLAGGKAGPTKHGPAKPVAAPQRRR
jgi:hypothetical protein